MHTWARKEILIAVFKGLGGYDVVAHFIYKIVDRLAGIGAVVAPNTQVNINHHAPAMLAAFPVTGFHIFQTLVGDSRQGSRASHRTGDF